MPVIIDAPINNWEIPRIENMAEHEAKKIAELKMMYLNFIIIRTHKKIAGDLPAILS